MLHLDAREGERDARDKRRDAAEQDATRRRIVKRQHGDRPAARQGADDKPADDRQGDAGRDADERGHQREVEASQRPRSNGDRCYLHECAPRRGWHADMRLKRREGARLRRDGLRHVPEEQRFGRRQGEQNRIDELLRIGRVSNQRTAAQAAHGQADKCRDAVQHRPAAAVGVHDRGAERCSGDLWQSLAQRGRQSTPLQNSLR